MIVGGSVAGEAPVTLPGGLAGIPRELNDRMEALHVETAHRYADITNIISHLAAQMALDASVEILVPVWVGDPIIADNRVAGLFVEGKSGRVAVKSKVVIDASADADVCRRAGVPVITDMAPDPSWPPVIRQEFLRPEFVPWNDTAIYFVMADVDFPSLRAVPRQRRHPHRRGRGLARRARAVSVRPPGVRRPHDPAAPPCLGNR